MDRSKWSGKNWWRHLLRSSALPRTQNVHVHGGNYFVIGWLVLTTSSQQSSPKVLVTSAWECRPVMSVLPMLAWALQQWAVEPQSTCHKRVRMSACHVSVANVGLSRRAAMLDYPNPNPNPVLSACHVSVANVGLSRRAAYVDDVRWLWAVNQSSVQRGQFIRRWPTRRLTTRRSVQRARRATRQSSVVSSLDADQRDDWPLDAQFSVPGGLHVNPAWSVH